MLCYYTAIIGWAWVLGEAGVAGFWPLVKGEGLLLGLFRLVGLVMKRYKMKGSKLKGPW